MNNDYICTWIYLDSPNESSEYPQVGKSSHLFGFQKTYWKCVAVFYALSVRFNPEKKHILFSNKKLDEFPEIEGFDLRSLIKTLNVEIVTIPLTWQTPEGYFGKWRNQFYIFDVLAYCESYLSKESALLILDSDCLINRGLDELFNEIHRKQLLVLPMPFTDDYDINGVNLKDMSRIFGELEGKVLENIPSYYGGEVFAGTQSTISKINSMVPKIWEDMMRRHEKGIQKLNEEAHFLSYCYYKIGNFGDLNQYIKRIWTSPKYTNVIEKDINLPIWHLPAEKTGGIALLFEKLKRNHLILPINDSEMSVELGKYVGLPKRKKWLDLKQYLKHSYLYKLYFSK